MTDTELEQGPAGLDQPRHGDGPEEHGGPLFEADRGQLPQYMRDTLVKILKRRYVSADRDPDTWRVLTEHRADLESRLNDVYLQLIVDRDYGVAYKRQAVSGTGGTFPTLLRNQPYNREQTILMVHLRGMFRSGRSQGDEAVFVDAEELADEIATYRPPQDTNHVKARQAAQRAIENLVTNEILLATTEAGRYRISPVIEVLLPVSVVQELAEALYAQTAGAAQESPAGDDAAGDDGDGEEESP